MHYLINEISKLIGISPTTIRYYEKIGIINLTKDEETGYRYFEPIDVNVLMRARILRGFGFSMQEVGSIMNTGKLESSTELLKGRRQGICREIEELQHLSEKLEERISLLEELDSKKPFQFSRRMRPEMLGIVYRDATAITGNAKLHKIISRWMEYAPYVFPLIIQDPETAEEERPNFQMGLCINADDAERMGAKEDAQVFRIEPRECMHTITEMRVDAILTGGVTNYMLDEITQQGFETEGLIYGRSLFSYRKDSELWSINEHWIPIE